MNKYDFTPLGMQQLLAALYALDDSALAAEAAALANDFTGWCLQHFNLDTSQLAYLMGMSPQMQEQLAQRGSYYLSHRLPINLMQANSPVGYTNLPNDDRDSAKIFDLEEKNNSTYSPNTGYQSSQVLNISITYPAIT